VLTSFSFHGIARRLAEGQAATFHPRVLRTQPHTPTTQAFSYTFLAPTGCVASASAPHTAPHALTPLHLPARILSPHTDTGGQTVWLPFLGGRHMDDGIAANRAVTTGARRGSGWTNKRGGKSASFVTACHRRPRRPALHHRSPRRASPHPFPRRFAIPRSLRSPCFSRSPRATATPPHPLLRSRLVPGLVIIRAVGRFSVLPTPGRTLRPAILCAWFGRADGHDTRFCALVRLADMVPGRVKEKATFTIILNVMAGMATNSTYANGSSKQRRAAFCAHHSCFLKKKEREEKKERKRRRRKKEREKREEEKKEEKREGRDRV